MSMYKAMPRYSAHLLRHLYSSSSNLHTNMRNFCALTSRPHHHHPHHHHSHHHHPRLPPLRPARARMQHDLNSDHAPLSAIICESQLSGCTLPLVASLQSQENHSTVNEMAVALQRTVPCCAECNHGFEHILDGYGAFRLYRTCRNPSRGASTPWQPTVGIGIRNPECP